MARTITIVSLAIGLSAFFVLIMFGFAIWVFLPVMPAAIVFVIAVAFARRRATTPPPKRTAESETDERKAA